MYQLSYIFIKILFLFKLIIPKNKKKITKITIILEYIFFKQKICNVCFYDCRRIIK